MAISNHELSYQLLEIENGSPTLRLAVVANHNMAVAVYDVACIDYPYKHLTLQHGARILREREAKKFVP